MLYYKAWIEMAGLTQDHTMGWLQMVSNDLNLENHRENWLESLAVNEMAYACEILFHVLGVLD